MLDGTWSSGALPEEIGDFALMRGMRWSWRELEETPLYVKTYCGAFLDEIGQRRKQEPDGA